MLICVTSQYLRVRGRGRAFVACWTSHVAHHMLHVTCYDLHAVHMPNKCTCSYRCTCYRRQTIQEPCSRIFSTTYYLSPHSLSTIPLDHREIAGLAQSVERQTLSHYKLMISNDSDL